MMLLSTALTLTICHSSSVTSESPRSLFNASPRRLSYFAAERLPTEDLETLLQKDRYLADILKPILQIRSFREIQDSLQQHLKATPDLFQDPFDDFMVREPETMVMEYLCGYDAPLHYDEDNEDADGEGGIEKRRIIRDFREKLRVHKLRFEEELWSPPIPDGEDGELVRKHRALCKTLQDIIVADGGDSELYNGMRFAMTTLGRLVGDPCLEPLKMDGEQKARLVDELQENYLGGGDT